MEVLFRDFQNANELGSGALLAATISPVPPPTYLNRLETIWNSTNHASAERDIGYGLTKSAPGPIKYPSQEITVWTDIYVSYWKSVGEILAIQEQNSDRADWGKCYEAWKDLANAVIRGYSSGVLEAWTLPVLYMTGKHLRSFAIKADDIGKKGENGVDIDMGGMGDDIAGNYGRNVKLEDAARVINRMFTLCISDRYVGFKLTRPFQELLVIHCAKTCVASRAPLDESRKWGLYYTTNLLFKTYFKLNSVGLSKNILRALSASKTDMPELDTFPKSHIVTFKYYVGVIQFLEEDYANAETNLTTAYSLCHYASPRNKELILTYLIPTRLLTSHRLPSAAILAPYPGLASLFKPLTTAIRSGSLSDFDRALAAGEPQFVKRRIYLTLERGRDICLRNLMRKVFLAAGIDDAGNRRTRIKVEEFRAAIKLGEGEEVEADEVECLIANMIYKVLMSQVSSYRFPSSFLFFSSALWLFLSFSARGKERHRADAQHTQNLMKGYIARANGIVVLSKTGAFPGTRI